MGRPTNKPRESEYTPPPLVDIQSMVNDPRRSMPKEVDPARVQASHLESLDTVRASLDEMNAKNPAPTDPTPEAVELARVRSMEEVRRTMQKSEDREIVIARERVAHESNQDLIRREMMGLSTVAYSGGNGGEG